MTSPNTFSLSPRVLATLGISIAQLCERAGVAQSNAWLTDDFFRLWKTADEVFQDRSAGIRFGAEGINRGYAVAAIVALHAPDFRHALAALSRYKRLTCPELVEVAIEGGEAIVRYHWLQATGDVPRLLVDTTMASLKELARRGTAGRVAPCRLELARRPADQAMLRHHFECPIVFGATSDAMVFDRTALDVPFVTADGGAFANVLADAETGITEGAGLSMRVAQLRVAIARQLSEGRRASITEVACRLNVSSRTLQRRLEQAETSFQQQLSIVRRTMAGRLLANTDLDAIAIGMLLGFAEPNSFARAFRSWEQSTPLRWRERQNPPPTSAMKENQQ